MGEEGSQAHWLGERSSRHPRWVTTSCSGAPIRRRPMRSSTFVRGDLHRNDLMAIVWPNAGITPLANLGNMFIVYLAAVELTLRHVKRSTRESGVFIAITSFILPLRSAVALGRLLALHLGSSMFLGIALAFTALPVS